MLILAVLVLKQFNAIVHPLPNTTIATLVQCDDDTDGITDFNLTEVESLIITDPENYNFSYYTSETEAQFSTNEIANPEVYNANTGQAFVRTENPTTGCFRVTAIDLVVSVTNITTTSFNETLNSCDDNDQDGITSFNLTDIDNSLKGIYTNPGTVINYYESEADALAEQNPITDITNHRNTNSPITQTLYIRIEDSITNACLGISPSIQLNVDPLPVFDLGDDYFLCVDPVSGLGQTTIDATPATPGNYQYFWSPSNPTKDNLGNESAVYTVTQSGTYSVQVLDLNTDEICFYDDEITITTSSAPANVTTRLISPLFSKNTATIEVLAEGGFGDYQYQIDDGPWQDEPIFEGVENGEHIVRVADKNGCGQVLEDTVATISYPTFFTPSNADNNNDTWNINGLRDDYQAVIYIFDRYGKLIKEISPYGDGWDGTYLNTLMPRDDYWFAIEYIENNQQKRFSSHFSLVR